MCVIKTESIFAKHKNQVNFCKLAPKTKSISNMNQVGFSEKSAIKSWKKMPHHTCMQVALDNGESIWLAGCM